MLKQLSLLTILAPLPIMFCISATAYAEGRTTPPEVVNKSSCGQLSDTTQAFILILKTGDEVVGSITQCAKEAKLTGARIIGLGQIRNPTLAYASDNPDEEPTLKTFSGYYELTSCNGNITMQGDKYITRVNAVIADKKFRGIVGRISSAKVGLNFEVTITPYRAS